MRVLITGIAGHIGSALAKWILANHAGVTITGVDDLSSGFRENVTDAVFHPADVREWRWPGGFDVVFHLAAYACESRSAFVRRHTIRNTMEATAAVINGCLTHGCGRLVLASSIAVYGRGVPPFRETDECFPIDPYGNCKLACERDVRIAHDQHGLEFCTVRPGNVYGPGQSLWAQHRNVLGLWMRAALEGEPPLVYGDGQQRRAFTYIDDLVPALWRAGTEPKASNKTLNLGSRWHWTIQHAAELTRRITGGLRIEHLPPRHEVGDAYSDSRQARELLGFPDRETEFEDGVKAMWDWARVAWDTYPERREAGVPADEVYLSPLRS